MTIETILKSKNVKDNSQKVALNIIYTLNILNENFNEFLKPYDLSVKQFNVLRILRGQNGKPANMCLTQITH